MATKDVLTLAPITAVVFVAICIVWLYAVKGLSKKVAAAQKRQDEKLAAEKAA